KSYHSFLSRHNWLLISTALLDPTVSESVPDVSLFWAAAKQDIFCFSCRYYSPEILEALREKEAVVDEAPELIALQENETAVDEASEIIASQGNETVVDQAQ
ncbi:hypothetical protein BDD12DRAFT_843298, partial [Trichophaea hybrida]